jgi:AAA domain
MVMYDPTIRCAHCGGRGGGSDWVPVDLVSNGRLVRTVTLHEHCVAAWEQTRKLGGATESRDAPLNGGRGPQIEVPFKTTATTRKQGNEPQHAVKPPKSKSRDANDVLRERGHAEVRRMADAAKPAAPPRHERKRSHSHPPGTWRDNLIDPQKLCDEQFPDVRYVVPGIIPEGVTLLASRPKLGKSWLILQTATAIATGTASLATSDQPTHGDVLYVALEDNKRRLKRRLAKYFGAQRENWPKQLALFTKWRRLDQGGIEDLREWCKSVNKPTLIAVDTLKKVRKPKGRNQSDYDADYEACEGLMELAREFPGLSIIVAHHDRKMDADDVFDTVSGTLGLTGGVDTIAIIRRSAKGITLHVEGRDLIDAVEKAVRFDRETCRWTILGDAAEVQRSADRSRVLAALQNAPEGLSTSEIISAAGLGSRNAADVLLFRMLADGEVERVRRGVYGLPGTSANLSAKKDRKIERKKPKPLKSQGESDLSFDLTQPPHRKKSRGADR